MNSENEGLIEKHAYVAPRVERVQVHIEGTFAASQSVNDYNSFNVDDWTKTTNVAQSSGTTIGSWDKE